MEPRAGWRGGQAGSPALKKVEEPQRAPPTPEPSATAEITVRPGARGLVCRSVQDSAVWTRQDGKPYLPALKRTAGVVASQTRHRSGTGIKKNLSVCPTHPSRNAVGSGGAGAHSPLQGQEAGPGTQSQAGLPHSAACFHVEGLRLVLKELRKGSSPGLLI